ncbi:MFS general substrate transporter [Byssothecium circinans]|uniref:MFS general substrate transporter n=1 Tax=Byssothecium circinans TaxID=147558 RepID=A0A6A5TUN8_9PLEO|nr:MFS general substrate transporter [Byssothecium circinans]
MSDRIGRKATLYVLWILLAASLIIETLVKDWKQWTGAKILAGIDVGAIQSTLPVYVTEWSPANIRGAIVLVYGFWSSFGKFLPPLVLLLCQNADPLDYKTPILTQWAFLGIMLPHISPLVTCTTKARQPFRRVNGGIPGYDVDVEYDIIKNTILEEQHTSEDTDTGGFRGVIRSYIDCFKGSDLMRTLGSTLPICAQQLTGLSFLDTYASLFFKQSGFNNAFLITIIMAIISLITATCLILATDRFGRRLVVLGAAILCSLALLLVGILGQVEKTKPLQDFLIFCGCLWSLGNNALGQLGWAFVGEVSSQRLRARTAGLGAGMSVVFGLTFNTAVPVMIDTEGANWGYNTAWLFFAIGSLICIMIYYYVPEPSQRNYAEMDEMYNKKIGARKMRT